MLNLLAVAILIWRLMPFGVSNLIRHMPFGVSNWH